MAALDFLTALVIILLQLNLIGFRIAAPFIIYMISKVIVFRGDLASIIDGVIGVYIILMLIGFNPVILTAIALIYLLQKIFVSFI